MTFKVKLNTHFIFDLKELTEVVEGAGLRVIESGSYSIKPFTHVQMENMVQAGLITNEMLVGLYKMEKYMPGLGSEIYVNARRK